MNGPTGKLPNWNVGHLHLVPDGDPRDTSMDSPARIAARAVDLKELERLRDTPVFKGCDDAWEEYLVIPTIHVRVRTSDREAAANALRTHLVVHVGGIHVDGFDPLYSVGPDIEVI